MQMRGNLHRYRVSPVRKKNRMLQGTFMPSYSPVLKKCRLWSLINSTTTRNRSVLSSRFGQWTC